MKFKSKSAIKKRIKITKTGKIKKLKAGRSHLQRHKKTKVKTLENLRCERKKILLNL
jgi:large subunit ribosomal protein L35